MSANGSKPLTIGTLAREAGVNLETVRFYERRGLLPEPPRSESGYRLYAPEGLKRLMFIKRAQELGFSLAEIDELLKLRPSGRSSCAQVRRRAEAKIEDIEAKIKTLQSMKRTLQKLTNECAGHDRASECPILDSLDGEKP